MEAPLTSLMILRKFLILRADGTLDASRVHSPECFTAWRLSRGLDVTPQSCKNFYRALTNHLSGVDGRYPFTPEEEIAVCKVLRTPGLWPCFPQGTKLCTSGYRGFGFHEKAHAKQQHPSPQPPRDSVSPVFRPKRLRCTDDSYLSQQERDHINEIVEHLDTFLASVGPKAAESAAHELFRMLLYTRCPSLARGEPKIAETLCAQLPSDDVVLVFDFSEGSFDLRIKAQNSKSLQRLGNLVGKSHSLYRFEDLKAVLRGTLVAMQRPGVPVVVPSVSICSATGEEILTELSFSFDPHTLLCTCRVAKLSTVF